MQTPPSLLKSFLQFCIDKRLIVIFGLMLLLGAGLLVSPFKPPFSIPLRYPVPVDAIPDIGENQQIVFTKWDGHSPQDVEDQITYPLTASLLGIPRVKSIRSFSMFGFSTIYIIFKDGADFYWSRSRILEKLNSLPSDTLPKEVQPVLGPDATALGQVFWYTLEGRDGEGNPSGGWDLQELRTLQDWYVRFALMSVEGISEVASVGGFVQEYQVDIDPDRMRIHQVSLTDVVDAVRKSNRDVGAQTLEINRVEYLIRGMGFIEKLSDIEDAVIRLNKNTPVFVKDVADVVLGPAPRQGALDKGGAETVGGVAVVRFGENPLEVIDRLKEKIAEISPGLPRKTLANGTQSQVQIVPFYDRTQLIHETLETLKTALTHEILITIIVVLVLSTGLRTAFLVSGILPVSVFGCFIAMKLFRVDANIVALSGIAIAIGTMVDMGIILVENILTRLKDAAPEENRRDVIVQAASEVAGAVMTAIATTLISFLPVFSLAAAEGKLFRPLAFTKTFALSASLFSAIILIPPFIYMLFPASRRNHPLLAAGGALLLTLITGFLFNWAAALIIGVCLVTAFIIRKSKLFRKPSFQKIPSHKILRLITAGGAVFLLTWIWNPLGIAISFWKQFFFVGFIILFVMGGFWLFYRYYEQILKSCLSHKILFLSIPCLFVILGLFIWLGIPRLLGWLPQGMQGNRLFAKASSVFPGLEREFMPSLDEGAFLLMPTTMPHASISEVMDIMRRQDMAISALPEVSSAVGKLGRAESALDPAPVSMIETVINYHSEYFLGAGGHPQRFKWNGEENDFFRTPEGHPALAPDGQPYKISGKFKRDENGHLVPDPNGHPFRLWRPPLNPNLNPGREAWPGIRNPDDIWEAIAAASAIPGVTTPAKLQPISARLVMLQSGIRSNIGIKVQGPDLETIQQVCLEMESLLRRSPAVDPRTVIADRMVGKPYLEIRVDRQAIAHYGIPLENVLTVIEYAIGGKSVTRTVEGRERYAVRIRYQRELRSDIESIGRILVASPTGIQVPLAQLSEIFYIRGPQVIKGEDGFLTGYVLFDKQSGYAEASAIESVSTFLETELKAGRWKLPEGVHYSFTGAFENRVRAEKRLQIILPAALVLIFIILHLQFNSVSTSLMVFSGIVVAWAGGFMMIWLYGQNWFLDFSIFGLSMRELFQVHPVHLSVAVWVGFLALFGIASDDGVVIASYLKQAFNHQKAESLSEVHAITVAACLRRVKPCLMTTMTTLLALIPVLTSSGRGADIMIPMAIPSFGGMTIEVVTMLVVPVLYCWREEQKLSEKK